MSKIRNFPKSIGGYLELELHHGKEYYPDLIHLNTGRNALEYILKQRKYSKAYLPYFTSDVLLEPINKLNIPHQFYSIDENLDPIVNFEIEDDACFLYTNYFGIKQRTVDALSKQISNLIIDNGQAFYSKPIPGVDTFYSCRKFFGVPDGAYLQLKKKTNKKLPIDLSFNRFSHLIKSVDLGTEAGYADYKANKKDLANNEILTMSRLTQKLLSSINYEACARIRERNFKFLHKHLEARNLLKIDIEAVHAPMVYPFLVNDRYLKVHLIQKKIFVATYWPNVFEWTTKGMYENFLAHCLVPLPIDQRYNLQDMFFMLNTLQQFL